MNLQTKSFVVSDKIALTNTLKNSLFYSDEISWSNISSIISISFVLVLMTKVPLLKALSPEANDLEKLGAELSDIAGNYYGEEGKLALVRIIKNYQKTAKLISSINSTGFNINPEFFLTPADSLTDFLLENENGAKNNDKLSLNNIDDIIKRTIKHISTNVDFFYCEPEHSAYLGENNKAKIWNPYKGVDELLVALRKTQVLPDISELPLPEIRKLKDLLKDDLILMNAEMLRMTEYLRKMVGENMSQENFSREAINLITTRVVPILLEYSIHAKSEMKNKFRKYMTKTLKMVGYTGLGFINPKSFFDAMKEGVGTIAEVSTDNLKYKPPTATASFAIKMEAGLKEIG